MPSSVRVKKTKALIRDNNSPIQKSLFDYVSDDEFNDMERSIAVYLDEQEKLLWWYRNLSKQDYYVQGWKKSRIYPDFIFSKSDATDRDFNKVYVIETKGIHLKGSEDTDYKKSVFRFCNEFGQKKEWQEIHKEFPRGIEFQVIAEDEWKKRINEIFEIP
ncbi:type III restriction protein res subunit [Candidatus Magnetoovum chiemensis]|nr:type III restriction protein res subunit [Candidatus Magnetoovum chiemensis]